MTPLSLQRSCRFELFISNLGHHLSFFLPTSIFSITHLVSFENNILRGKCFYTVLISLLHLFVSFQPAFQKVIITFQVPSQKFTELCYFHRMREVWAPRKAEQRGRIISPTLLATLLLVQPRMQLAFRAASTHRWVMSSCSSASLWTWSMMVSLLLNPTQSESWTKCLFKNNALHLFVQYCPSSKAAAGLNQWGAEGCLNWRSSINSMKSTDISAVLNMYPGHNKLQPQVI